MSQYEHKEDEKPRVKLPLVKDNAEARIRDLEIKLAHHAAIIEKLHRENSRLKADIADVRSILRTILR